jgi:transcription elongation factor SPT5
MGDSMLPRSAIMPDVNDPTIWGLRVKKGRERDIVMSIFRKAVANELNISSAFCRDSIEGFVYVEARFEAHVRAACHGIVGVYANNSLLLVPLEERPDLLRTKKREIDLKEGGWVRLKRGKYAGDLAQIVEISESGSELTLRYIPRIDYTPREKDTVVGSDGKKRKKGGGAAAAISFRPPAAFFNADAVKRAYGQKSIKFTNGEYAFGNDVFRDGYLIKEHTLTSVVVESVNPTIDEITNFAGDRAADKPEARQDDEDADGEGRDRQDPEKQRGVNYSILAEAQRKAANIILQPGDHVEVHEGDQKGIEGLVESIINDVVSVAPSQTLHPELVGTKIDVSIKSVRKRFKIGDHVKVLAGTNVDETGLVTNVDGDILTFISDLSQKQVQVFSKDVREAAEVGAGVNVIGQYELHDLVQLECVSPTTFLSALSLILGSATTSGVIFKTERDMFRVLDQTGTVRTLKPAQISGKIDSSRTIATDSEGIDIRPGDMVKEQGATGFVRSLPCAPVLS